jgi:hypothetical protein
METNKRPDEEIAILDLFRALGQFFQSIVKGVAFLFRKLLFLFLSLLLFLKKNAYYLGAGILAGIIFAFIFDKNYQPEYKSSLFVKLNYQSYPAMEGKIESLNSMIEKENYSQLAKELNLEKDMAETLISFDLKPIQNDVALLKDYEKFMISMDTSVHKFMPFEDFKEQIKARKVFPPYNQIRVKAHSPHVFRMLNPYFENILEENPVLKQKKEVKTGFLKQKIKKLNESLAEVDSLRKVLNKVYLESASKVSQGEVIINNASQNRIEKPYDLFETRINLLDILNKTDQELLENDRVVMLYNTFPELGEKQSIVSYNPYIKFPFYGFVLVLFMILLIQLNKILIDFQQKTEERDEVN